MTSNRKPTGRASSFPAGLAWGTAAALILTGAGAAVTAVLVDREILQWEQIGYAVMLILLLSSWTAGMVTSGKIRQKRPSACLGAGGVYFVMLLAITGLFFGGQYSGVAETGLLVFCGSMLGLFLGYPGKNGRKRQKNGYVHR